MHNETESKLSKSRIGGVASALRQQISCRTDNGVVIVLDRYVNSACIENMMSEALLGPEGAKFACIVKQYGSSRP
jgi:hypothetical protein